jgi:hypothetical protein
MEVPPMGSVAVCTFGGVRSSPSAVGTDSSTAFYESGKKLLNFVV